MRSRPTIRQSDITRAIRAAKAPGGYAVVVRPDGSIAFELVGNSFEGGTRPQDSAEPNLQIVL